MIIINLFGLNFNNHMVLQVVNTRGNFNYGMKGAQSQNVYKGIRDVLSSVYREGGFRGLYRGVGMYLLA